MVPSPPALSCVRPSGFPNLSVTHFSTLATSAAARISVTPSLAALGGFQALTCATPHPNPDGPVTVPSCEQEWNQGCLSRCGVQTECDKIKLWLLHVFKQTRTRRVASGELLDPSVNCRYELHRRQGGSEDAVGDSEGKGSPPRSAAGAQSWGADPGCLDSRTSGLDLWVPVQPTLPFCSGAGLRGHGAWRGLSQCSDTRPHGPSLGRSSQPPGLRVRCSAPCERLPVPSTP